jgi:ABC-type dipeptide/oligopeptide/nickel transport system permease component
VGSYIARRVLQGIFTLLATTLLFHASITVLPGDPVRALFGFRRPNPLIAAEIKERFHLDEPYFVQYGHYLWDLLHGDLGMSYPFSVFTSRGGTPVNPLVESALPISARILVTAILLQLVLGLALGMLMSVRQHTKITRWLYLGVVLAAAVPVIVSAFALKDVFANSLQVLPYGGVRDGWRSYVMPVIAVAATGTAYVVLLTRSELMNTLRQRYIKAAEARAIPEYRIVGLHALRASLLPALTYVAANLGQLVTGLLIVEGIFNIPGLGGLMFTAIQRQDRSLLVSIILLVTVAVIIANILADVLYAVIDPRIRLGRSS